MHFPCSIQLTAVLPSRGTDKQSSQKTSENLHFQRQTDLHCNHENQCKHQKPHLHISSSTCQYFVKTRERNQRVLLSLNFSSCHFPHSHHFPLHTHSQGHHVCCCYTSKKTQLFPGLTLREISVKDTEIQPVRFLEELQEWLSKVVLAKSKGFPFVLPSFPHAKTLQRR